MWKINAFRTLTTESLAVFIPFKVQEIQDKGGIYFGENAISHNLIMCSKANLLTKPAFLLGVPGGGKSFSAKELIAFLKYYHFVRAAFEDSSGGLELHHPLWPAPFSLSIPCGEAVPAGSAKSDRARKVIT